MAPAFEPHDFVLHSGVNQGGNQALCLARRHGLILPPLEDQDWRTAVADERDGGGTLDESAGPGWAAQKVRKKITVRFSCGLAQGPLG